MTKSASIASITEVSETFQQLLRLECCLAQKALALTRRSPCGTVTPCEWEALYRQQATLDAVKGSLDGVGGYWSMTVTFDLDAPIGTTVPFYLQNLPLATYMVIEGDTPGEADITESVAIFAAALRLALDNTVGGFQLNQWEGEFPIVTVCPEDNTLTLWLHPYAAAYAPDGYNLTPDVGDWVLRGLVQATAVGQNIPATSGTTFALLTTYLGVTPLPTISLQTVVTDPTTQIAVGINLAATAVNFAGFFAGTGNPWYDYVELTGLSGTGSTLTASWALKPNFASTSGANGNTWSVAVTSSVVPGGTVAFSGGQDGSDFYTATEFVGGEWPLGVTAWCVAPKDIREMYSELVSACCVGCGTENDVPTGYVDATGGDCCECDGPEPDYPDFNASFVR